MTREQTNYTTLSCITVPTVFASSKNNDVRGGTHRMYHGAGRDVVEVGLVNWTTGKINGNNNDTRDREGFLCFVVIT